MIEVKNVVKSFDGFRALDGLTLTVPDGAVYGLVGPNGAGKTTAIRHLTGVFRPDSGSVTFGGQPVFENPDVKARIGLIPDEIFFFPSASISDMRPFYKGMYPHFDDALYKRLREVFQLPETGPIRRFSKGMQKQAAFHLAMCLRPDVLILDEPASPLDPLMRDRLCQMIRNYIEEGNGKHTAFYSTHDIADMEGVTDYVIILEHGMVVEEGFSEDLKEKYVIVKGDEKDIEAAKKILYTITVNKYGFEGMCLAENLDQLAGLDVVKETPTLAQVCIAVMKANSMLK